MTRSDYLLVMKQVGIAELKARLSHYLREVSQGQPITIVDRDRPVALLVPIEAATSGMVVRRPVRRFQRLQDVPLPPPLRLSEDVVTYLMAERQGKR